MAGKHDQQMKEITEKLEQGVKELFTSDMYADYLKAMSQFHNYSFNNTVLIAMQKPEATLVAGYQAWQKKFNRYVKRGEKAIQIIAPVPIREKQEMEKIDPVTQEPVLRPDGRPETEELEVVIPRFRITSVFDVSQTDGDPLPELATPELMGSMENFSQFMEAIKVVSPVPVRFDEIESEAKGYYDNEKKEIVIQEGMSESQTMKTAVHEVTHAKLHDRELMEELGEEKGQMTREVEAESVAYTVCQYFGLDTSDYSFPYIAGWSSSMDMKELRLSMDTIRKTAGEFIEHMTKVLQELMQNQPEKEHLEENDLILVTSFPSTGFTTYFIVENMDKGELLVQLKSYHELYSQSNEMTVETFLEGQGVRLYPWHDTGSLTVEYPVNFYDVAYDYDAGVSDVSALSTMKQAELLIHRAEYGRTIFSDEDRNLIVNYAFKFDDIKETKVLIEDLKDAIENDGIREAYEIRQEAQEQIDALPDGMIGLYEMHQFGYYAEAVLPLTVERAMELHQAGEHVYSLHKDGSRTLMNTEEDILADGGMFGIETRAWESYQIMKAVSKEKEVENDNKMHQEPEHGQENLLFDGTGNRYGIYQLKGDSGNEYRFMNFEFVREHGMEVKGTDYQFMYGDVLSDQESLDSLFYKFNVNRPEDFVGHSLSISDVIVMIKDGEVKSYYVDSFGFEELPDFVRERELELGIASEQVITQETKSYPPVYMYPLTYAMEHSAADEYLDSRKLNLDCKKAIESAIREHFDGMHLEHSVAVPVLEMYGAERVTFILANNIQQNMSDGRFSRENKAWAEKVSIPENIVRGININADYIVDSHPAVLDGFIGLARSGIQEQTLKPMQNNILETESESRDDERAYQIEDRYLFIQTTEEGYDYTYYDEDFREWDGGILDDPKLSFREALDDILEGEGFYLEQCREVEVSYLQEKIQEIEQLDFRKLEEMADKTASSIETDQNKIPLISDKITPEASLNGQSPAEIEETVICYVQAQMDAMNLTDKVELLGARVYGSRTRTGLFTENSDVEVAVSYSGDIAEDILSNKLHEDGLKIAGLSIDFYPISVDKTGTLEEYLNKAEKLLDKQETQKLTTDIVKFSMNYKEDVLKFWNIEDDIDTNSLDQAHEIIFNALIKKDTDQYVGHLESLIHKHKAEEDIVKEAADLLGRITGKLVSILPDPQISFYVAECMEFPVLGEYHENLTFQEAVELYKKIPAERINGIKGIGFNLKDGSIYDGNFDLMTGGKIQKDIINDILHYRKSPLVQKAITDMESVLSGWENVQTEQTINEPEAISKKQSVLNALRERKAKLKAKGQSKQGQTSQSQKKGEAEL